MNFYVLQKSKNSKNVFSTEFLPSDLVKTGSPPKCSQCGSYIGMLPLLSPVSVELNLYGTEYGDIVFGSGEEVLVKNSLINLFNDAGLTGFTYISDVQIDKTRFHNKKIYSPLPNYSCFNIFRSNAVIDQEKSGLEYENPPTCFQCRIGGVIKRIGRLAIVDHTWSGEDIFFARGLPIVIIASEKFADFYRKNNITNCDLIYADDYSFDYYPWEFGRARTFNS